MDQLKKTRLDFKISQTAAISRKSASNLIKSSKVLVNNKIITKPSHLIASGDKLDIDQKAASLSLKTPKLKVIYEDNDVVVIDKPVGLLTHSKGAYNSEATVASWLNAKVPSMTGERSGIVHRLDRATSGVMILAKNEATLKFLQTQFSKRKTKKTYIAVVEGVPQKQHAVIDMPIERNPKKPQTFRVGPNGKTAQTEYRVISHNDSTSLVELKPVTGRTHQLRVHLQKIGHPIIGDALYGTVEAERLYLHARVLEITLPGGRRQVFESALPKQFKI